jgi:hypothetical protein
MRKLILLVIIAATAVQLALVDVCAAQEGNPSVRDKAQQCVQEAYKHGLTHLISLGEVQTPTPDRYGPSAISYGVKVVGVSDESSVAVFACHGERVAPLAIVPPDTLWKEEVETKLAPEEDTRVRCQFSSQGFSLAGDVAEWLYTANRAQNGESITPKPGENTLWDVCGMVHSGRVFKVSLVREDGGDRANIMLECFSRDGKEVVEVIGFRIFPQELMCRGAPRVGAPRSLIISF